MENGQDFVDYYALFKVDPACDAKMLEKAYRHFAQLYHPDHPETADIEKFQEINEAYSLLRDPKKRANYNRVYEAKKADEANGHAKSEEVRVDQSSAIDDAEAHEKILAQLYNRRREHAEDPGVLRFHVQDMLKCSDDSLDFHVWYLKSKGFINVTEQGTLAITIEGVDHVIARSQSSEEARILQISKPAPDED